MLLRQVLLLWIFAVLFGNRLLTKARWFPEPYVFMYVLVGKISIRYV